MFATRYPLLFLFNDASQIFIVRLFCFLDAGYQLRHDTSFIHGREGTIIVHTTVGEVSSLWLRIDRMDVMQFNSNKNEPVRIGD